MNELAVLRKAVIEGEVAASVAAMLAAASVDLARRLAGQ